MGHHRSGLHRRSWILAAVLLAGCPTVDLGDTPDDINLCNPPGGPDYFNAEVFPNYIQAGNCTMAGGCHAEGGGNALNFRTGDNTFNYRQAQVFLNCGTPEMSPLLTKPLAGVDTHGGGDIFTSTSDPAAQVFLGWF